MKNNSVLPTSQHVLTQSKLQSIDFGFGEISKIITSLDVNKAIIIRVHEKNDKRNFENYCPISLLSIFGKVFKKIIFIKCTLSFKTSKS